MHFLLEGVCCYDFNYIIPFCMKTTFWSWNLEFKEWIEERNTHVTRSWVVPESEQLEARCGVRLNSAEHFKSRYFRPHSTKVVKNVHAYSRDMLPYFLARSSATSSGNWLLSGGTQVRVTRASRSSTRSWNYRIKYLKFSENSNCSSLITETQMTKKCIKISALEMKCFVMSAGLTFEDLIPRGNSC